MTKAPRRLAVALLFGTAMSLATAQGQSPAAAHEFFKAIAASQTVLATDLLADQPGRMVVVGLESAGCQSRITVMRAGAPAERLLDWKTVRTVRNEGERDLRLAGRGVDILLGFETREVAVRAFNALGMVRRDCDPIGGFGF